jgi:hypothetical protein
MTTNITITLLRLEFQQLFTTSCKYISWVGNRKFRLSACLWLSWGEDLLNAHPLTPDVCLSHSFRYILSQGAPGRERKSCSTPVPINPNKKFTRMENESFTNLHTQLIRWRRHVKRALFQTYKNGK